MNPEIAIGVALLVIAAFAIFKSEIAAWFKRVKGTKGAQTVLADVAKVKDAVEHTVDAVKPDPVAAAAPVAATATNVASGTPEAAHASLDAQIAAAQQAIADAQAKKDALTKAQQALNEAVGAVK